jgi:hypothetical protein
LVSLAPRCNAQRSHYRPFHRHDRVWIAEVTGAARKQHHGREFLRTGARRQAQEILLEAVPRAHRIAILADGNISTPEQIKALQEAARAREVEPSVFYVRTAGDITPVMGQIKASGAAAINVLSSILVFANRRALIERCAALRLPAIYEWPEMAEEGGLLAYGARLSGNLPPDGTNGRQGASRRQNRRNPCRAANAIRACH